MSLHFFCVMHWNSKSANPERSLIEIDILIYECKKEDGYKHLRGNVSSYFLRLYLRLILLRCAIAVIFERRQMKSLEIG